LSGRSRLSEQEVINNSGYFFLITDWTKHVYEWSQINQFFALWWLDIRYQRKKSNYHSVLRITVAMKLPSKLLVLSNVFYN
jgi:hypothetical protein